MRRLPSLNLLRAFERAAYHRSFKLAAEDLFVTPSAISHKIKQLEEEIGVPLFHRMTRSIRMTSAGQDFYKHVHRAFARLERGTEELRDRHGRQVLRLYMLPFFASEVLVPRLHSFQQQFPDIDLRIESAFGSTEQLPDDVDLTITLGLGSWPGLVSDRLMELSLLPVASRDVAERLDGQDVEALNQETIIHFQSNLDAWELWARGVNMNEFRPRGSLTVDSMFSALQAAEQGLGVAQAVLPLCEERLSQGNLKTPFPDPIEIPESYYLLHRKADEVRPSIQKFREWILTELKDL